MNISSRIWVSSVFGRSFIFETFRDRRRSKVATIYARDLRIEITSHSWHQTNPWDMILNGKIFLFVCDKLKLIQLLCTKQELNRFQVVNFYPRHCIICIKNVMISFWGINPFQFHQKWFRWMFTKSNITFPNNSTHFTFTKIWWLFSGSFNFSLVWPIFEVILEVKYRFRGMATSILLKVNLSEIGKWTFLVACLSLLKSCNLERKIIKNNISIFPGFHIDQNHCLRQIDRMQIDQKWHVQIDWKVATYLPLC